jgi:hypothetical protein
MATGTSFKQQCPSCEAMVPIRDPGLVGRKIDCPKCKYRFIVQEPAGEEDEDEKPGKKGKSDKGAKPVAKGPSKGGKEDDDRAGKKQKGSGKVLILGIGLGATALVAVVVCVVALSSGGDSPKPAGTTSGPAPAPIPMPETKKAEAPKEKPVETPKYVDSSKPTNLLPNDTQVVISYPMRKTLGSSLRTAALDAAGSYRQEAFKQTLGFGVDDINRIVTGLNIKDNWVFTVVQTTKPYQQDPIKAQLALTAEPKVKSKTGKSYDLYLINEDLDSLGNLLLKANLPREKFGVSFLDANTLVFADPEPLKKFLEGDAKPAYLTQPPSAEGAKPKTTGAPPAAGGMSSPMPGGAAYPMPGTTTPMPGTTTPMPGTTTPMPGTTTPMPGGAGYPMPGGAGYPMPGMHGMPGVQTAPAEPPAPPSYLTVKPELKTMLDRIEKLEVNKKSNKKEAASVITVVCDVGAIEESFKKRIREQLDEVPMSDLQKGMVVGLWNTLLKDMRTVGASVVAYDQNNANVHLALEVASRNFADSLEKTFNTLAPLALPAIKDALDLKITIPGKTNNQGMPGYPMGPGMYPMPGTTVAAPMPGTTLPSGTNPMGGYPMPSYGGATGTQPKEEKPDGTLALHREDLLLVCSFEATLTTTAYDKISAGVGDVMVQVKGTSDLVTTRSRMHELAAAVGAYVKEKGAFPPGALARTTSSERGLPYRPDQRLSWAGALLPYLAEELRDWKLDESQGWSEGNNGQIAHRVVPQLLVPSVKEAGPVQVAYPGLPGMPFSATHWVGISGLGMDAAEYMPGNPATDKKLGIFGYDRVTKKEDVKDGLDKTIALLLVPGDHKAPWLAGGGATVRGVSENDNDGKPIAPFVCTTYPADPDKKSKFDGKRGTLAIMADGKVRFIPEDLPAATFRALCTIAGGEQIEGKINDLCPEIVNKERTLKTEVIVPVAPRIPPAVKGGTPAPAPGKAGTPAPAAGKGTTPAPAPAAGKDGKAAPAPDKGATPAPAAGKGGTGDQPAKPR